MLAFTGETVLVTGAGAGIGFGMAQAFHEAGARVAIGDNRPAAVERAASRLDDRERVFAATVDVRDAASVAAFVAGAEEALGPVTVAVANAGIYPNTPVLDMSVEEWDRVMETNVRGVFLTCQAVARGMVARGTLGRIITISSGAYQSGRVGAAHYCASKAGVVMFTKVLALELAKHRINVNCIAPGLVEVNSEVSPISEEYFRTLAAGIPLGRVGTPQDIANAAMMLASPYAEFITGEVLMVNGGSSAGRAFLPLSTPRPSG
ncbi:MAG TPA: SDR family NAD(P)-dependent oxidoreductase [Thermomicrobiales bacterium]|nr:SDR family NAD(P)-dependent oxidoreductase [Thermomicrobiales bacterium]